MKIQIFLVSKASSELLQAFADIYFWMPQTLDFHKPIRRWNIKEVHASKFGAAMGNIKSTIVWNLAFPRTEGPKSGWQAAASTHSGYRTQGVFLKVGIYCCSFKELSRIHYFPLKIKMVVVMLPPSFIYLQPPSCYRTQEVGKPGFNAFFSLNGLKSCLQSPMRMPYTPGYRQSQGVHSHSTVKVVPVFRDRDNRRENKECDWVA